MRARAISYLAKVCHRQILSPSCLQSSTRKPCNLWPDYPTIITCAPLISYSFDPLTYFIFLFCRASLYSIHKCKYYIYLQLNAHAWNNNNNNQMAGPPKEHSPSLSPLSIRIHIKPLLHSSFQQSLAFELLIVFYYVLLAIVGSRTQNRRVIVYCIIFIAN